MKKKKEEEEAKKKTADEENPNLLNQVVKKAQWFDEFIEEQTFDIARTFTLLFVKVMAILVSLSFNDAIIRTIYEDKDGANKVFLAFFTSFLVTFVFLYLLQRYGKQIEDARKNKLEGNEFAYTSKQNERVYWTLITDALQFSIAVSWRNAFKTLFDELYGKEQSDLVVGNLSYAIFLTIAVSICFYFTEVYSCCVPKHDYLPLQPGSQDRELFATTVEKAMKAAVGLAWVDTIVLALEAFEKHETQMWALVIYMFFTIALSIIWSTCLGMWILNTTLGATHDFFTFVDHFSDVIKVGHVTKEMDHTVGYYFDSCTRIIKIFHDIT
eukprot:UN34829